MHKSDVASSHYFSTMMARFSFGYFTSKSSHDPISANRHELAQKYRDCLNLMDTQADEILLIKSALKQCNQDIVSSDKDVKSTVVNYHFFQRVIVEPMAAKSRNLEHRIELFTHLSMLLSNYPRLSTDETLTVDQLDFFYRDSEQHHANVLSILQNYLPETYAALKM